MRLSRLILEDYRSYARTEVALEPGPNVLLGYNGVGKTNIAEAIGYLSSLSSHRVHQDAPLIRHGQDQAIIRAQAHRGTREALLEVEINPGRSNRARINRGSPVRATEILGILRTVLFAPEDIELIKGSPEVRRKFLDTLVVQLHPTLAQARQDYEKVLRQRNALLKSIKYEGFTATHQSTLAVWDQQLAQSGATLLKARLDVVTALRPHLRQAYHDLSHSVRSANFTYQSSLTPESDSTAGPTSAKDTSTQRSSVQGSSTPSTSGPATAVSGIAESDPAASASSATTDLASATTAELTELFISRLAEVHHQERERSLTLVGPHRDDLNLSLDTTPVKGYASHGETWSFALSMRLASYRVMLADDPTPGSEPILILDDVFAELDARRRQRLAQLATGEGADTAPGQLVITAAVDDDVPEALLTNAYRVESVDQISQVTRYE